MGRGKKREARDRRRTNFCIARILFRTYFLACDALNVQKDIHKGEKERRIAQSENSNRENKETAAPTVTFQGRGGG